MIKPPTFIRLGPQCIGRIVRTVRGNSFAYAKLRNASYVIEKALMCCAPPDAQAIASEILEDSDWLLMLAVHKSGSHVKASDSEAGYPISVQYVSRDKCLAI